MKKVYFLVLYLLTMQPGFSQQITQVFYVGDKGVTEDIKEANAFIIIKKIANGHFERYNYKMSGPLVSMRTYSDASLSILDGFAVNYNASGLMTSSGKYAGGTKDKTWFFYNDTFKVVKKEIYEMGILMQTIDPDSVKDDDIPEYDDAKDADFKGGLAGWKKFLVKNINSDIALNTKEGGNVIISFTISTDGKLEDVYLAKSAQFILDEEAFRVIYKSPDWKPAFQNGRNVVAYRRQPLTFAN